MIRDMPSIEFFIWSRIPFLLERIFTIYVKAEERGMKMVVFCVTLIRLYIW